MQLRLPTKEEVQKYWVNEGPKLVILLLYILGNAAGFIYTFYIYRFPEEESHKKAFELLGYGLCFARAFAMVLKINCTLVLIPVLRNLLSWLRGTFLNNFVPFDKNITFHKGIAWVICFATFGHVMGHFNNYRIYEEGAAYNGIDDFGIAKGTTAYDLAFRTLAGWTGYVVVVVMIIMYTTAIESVRRPMFEYFWYSHHLFIVFFGLLVVHGLHSRLQETSFWKWVIGPCALYIIERLIRLLRSKKTTMLMQCRIHPSRVIELRMKTEHFKYKPGQYLFLNCPTIAQNEWHPFTITSAPEEDFVSVHINVVGNWTGKLSTLMNPDKKLGIVQENVLNAPDGKPILRIDGPYGAASEEVFKYKQVILIGAGIGVTPFASILKHIKFQLARTYTTTPLIEKVHFYWICRDRSSFAWFSGLIGALEMENHNNYLEIFPYLTGALSAQEIRDVMYGDEEKDLITGFTSPTQFGRPKWNEIFSDYALRYANKDVGVFFCGPKLLSKTLYKNATHFTKHSTCKFHYNKENF
ncbi:superoxide-generating NADPH oxidase flavocytochrome [Dictyostelium purpureum]|uniref:Superoxide-generating NADPH oxidase flavocytochrome n=1 Tax=Dictyostelium purpureum TaxID=5786 RepID=F0ZID3_DICPU|nr:superoxide-generating NADPH oxidase flavocytochrome [Dictyostelium purpureum]EGC36287.1 superoxide-generating NADPH oxidase flavocytochrome [Dictyostelium purpureum]|eukprot:XP_003287165.1 superoxide-generating NADPH oxidase flavocytochrome [Dictyostelium purpureum]